MTVPMTAEQANAVYDVLVDRAGAPETQRDMFVFTETDRLVHEYRFGGALGFGGKFWRTTGLRRDDADLKWSVSAYPEDVQRRPEMKRIIDKTNQALAGLIGAMEES